MQDKIKKYLYDILISANSIFEYLGGKEILLFMKMTNYYEEQLSENLK